jgi:hypothetical protein
LKIRSGSVRLSGPKESSEVRELNCSVIIITYSVVQNAPFKKQPELPQYMQTYREQECNKTHEFLVLLFTCVNLHNRF